MAIFKDKTGRGEVNYNKAPVKSSDGNAIFLNELHDDNTVKPTENLYTTGVPALTVFQIRGEPAVQDISDFKWARTDASSQLVTRLENVTHKQRLKTFELDSQRIDFTPKLGGFFGLARSHPMIESISGQYVNGNLLPYTQITGSNTINVAPDFNDYNQAVISFWIYANEYGQGTNGGGSTIIEHGESSSHTRSFGVILTQTGELVFRLYDFRAINNQSIGNAVHFQQLKTTKKINLKQWYHVTIFFYAMPGTVDADGDGIRDTPAYNSNGLHAHHQAWLTAPESPSPGQVAIFINGEEEKNYTNAGKTSGNFSGGGSTSAVWSQNSTITIGFGLAGYDSDADGLGNPQFQGDSTAYFKGRLAEVTYHLLGGNAANIIRRKQGTESAKNYRSIIARALMTGARQPASGITNVNERLILRELDGNSTHPTVSRSGDERRLGNHIVKFDDSRAQSLRGSEVHYPTKMLNNDRLFGSVYQGYIDGRLSLQHSASFETYDNFYRREDQPSLAPFNESRIYIDTNKEFYSTGTPESIIPGFNQPLTRKSSFVIDLNPVQATEFGFTGSLNHQENGVNTVDTSGNGSFNAINNAASPSGAAVTVPTGSLMMYWNNNTKRFEKKGRIHSTKFDYLKNRNTGDGSVGTSITPEEIRKEYEDNLCTGFSRTSTLETVILSSSNGGGSISSGGVYEAVNGDKTIFELTARPISTWGFPFAKKYEHADNGHINMSDYITEPFLLEKVVYEFSASFEAGTSYQTDAGRNALGFMFGGSNPSMGPGTANVSTNVQHHHYSFFMLREFANPQPRVDKITGVFEENSSVNDFIPASGGFGQTFAQQFSGSNKSRELIGYGQVFLSFRTKTNSFYDSTTYNYIKNSGYGREVNIEVDTANPGSDGTGVTGSFRMEFSPSVTPKYDVSSPVRLSFPHNSADGLDNHLIFDYYVGGRGNEFDIETRGIARSIVGKDPAETGLIFTSTANSNPLFGTKVDNVTPQTSPYILLPEDKLIFGWNAPTELSDGFSGLNAKRAVMSVLPNKGKVIFYGSFLQNSQPRQFSLNQNLHNDIVHESIGAESIHDQFDIEPRGHFTGSFADEVMSGSTVAPYNGYNSDTNHFTDLARRVAGRSSRGTLGTAGSLKRVVSIASEDKTEFDSFLFDLKGVFGTDERSGVDPNSNLAPGTGRPTSFIVKDENNAVSLLIGDDPKIVGSLASDRGVRPNVDVGKAYYFSRYHNVTRVRQEQVAGPAKLIQVVVTGSSPHVNVGVVDPTIPAVSGLVASTTPSPFGFRENVLAQNETFSALSPINAFNKIDAAKFFFGKSDELNGAYRAQHLVNNIYAMNPSKRIRGFRYGFSNITDKKPRLIYRRDRYGQFRDLLEMAPNTAYVDDKTNTLTFSVEAQFFADDGSIAAPEATSSSNLSTNVTSSAPFFDRDTVEFADKLVIRNRGPFNNKVVDITIEI